MRRRLEKCSNLRQQGAALLLVLWVVALLSVMAATLLLIIDRSSKDAQQMLVRLRTQALVDSALSRTIWLLTAPDPREHLPTDGQFHGIEIVGGTAQVAVSDESGRIDINTASPQLLQALFAVAGANEAQSKALSTFIETQRKSERSVLLNVADLQQLNGVTTELYQQIAPFLTVYTRAPAVDPHYASATVRRALVNAQLADHQILLAEPTNTDDARSLAGRVLRLAIKATTGDGGIQAQDIVLRLTGDPRQPYWLLDDGPASTNPGR